MTSSPTSSLFDACEWLRYSRHVQLPQLGASGQTRLKKARVLVVGCGGLGSPVLLYLAAAGVGHLTLIDGDVVDLSNLQRQVLFEQEDIGLPKAVKAQEHLNRLNSAITIEAIDQPLSVYNGAALVQDHDLIVDCTDNFETRYLINDLCVQKDKPWIFASVYQFSGQCALFVPGGPCFRCLFPDMPADVPDCNAAGVLGVLPGMVGIFQACEAIKYLTGLVTPLANHLLLVEALDMDFRRIQLRRNLECEGCGETKRAMRSSSSSATRNPVPGPASGAGHEPSEILAQDGDSLLLSTERFNEQRDSERSLVLDVRSAEERQAFHIGGDHLPLQELPEAILHLTRDRIIICYCQSGSRSLEAAQQLRDAGLTAYSLTGGLSQWLRHRELDTES